MSRKRTTIEISSAEIASWWYDYVCHLHDCGKQQYIQKWMERWTIDIGEPRCWGCGSYSEKWDAIWLEKKRGHRLSRKEILENWNHVPLIRCHIIPHSRGGKDSPNNLVLLCVVCHESAPDCTNPKYMFTWLNNREEQYREELTYRTTIACKHLGIENIDIAQMIAEIDLSGETEAMNRFSDEYSSTHMSPQGPIYKTTTHFSSIMEYYRKTRGAFDRNISRTRIETILDQLASVRGD